jgi:hypothetical protein
MIPLAFVLDPGAQAESSLGTVVIGGLGSSLLLTLLLVPVVYVAMAAKPVRADGELPPPRGASPARTPLPDAGARR